MRPKLPWQPLLALLLLTLIWGYTWVLSKIGLRYAPPIAFAAQRSIGGALALFIALPLAGRSLRIRAIRPVFWIGLFQTTLFLGLQGWALVEGGPGKTAVLIYTMPIWTLMVAWPVLGERIRGIQWIAVAGAVAGLVLIISPWDMHTSLLSKILGITSAMAWAIGTVLVKQLQTRRPEDLLALTAWQMMIGAVMLGLVAWQLPEPQTQWTPTYLGILTLMALFGTALGWLLWLYILERLPAWEASLSVLGTPIVAILSSRLQLGERFTGAEIGGMILVGLALGFLSFQGWRMARPATRPLQAPSGQPQ
ncbi:MAG: EamA family transporter [Proteobacteria bacterium]|nr:EamA family transporter [Pseudomonadota bacterium]HQR04756.1 EamA family transporter [Rhodocyclaceae bacterium]